MMTPKLYHFAISLQSMGAKLFYIDSTVYSRGATLNFNILSPVATGFSRRHRISGNHEPGIRLSVSTGYDTPVP